MEKNVFVKSHPEYGYNGTIDEMYEREFAKRLGSTTVYLDHAGATLYTQSQLDAHFDQLRCLTLNNPHSEREDSPSSLLIRECIEFILSTLETSSRHYSLIFTLNATHACQMLASLFPFTSQSEFAYMIDSHNSVIGIRQQAKLKGASFSIIDHPAHIYNQEETEVDDCSFRCACPLPPLDLPVTSPTYCLFATPAENNFNGLRPPMDALIGPFLRARERRPTEVNLLPASFPVPVHRSPSPLCHWLTLVDCAKMLSTKPFSLTTYPVDFLILSFYKLFGYPTGLGALIIRNESLPLLDKRAYFGGGSVRYVSPLDDSRLEHKDGVDGLINGTIPFTAVLALRHGFHLLTCTLSYRRISTHTQCLIDYCRNEMIKFNYFNGQILCVFYDARQILTKKSTYSFGPTLNFNLYNRQGRFLSCRLIQRLASDHNIVLRAGTFCAPGASQAYLGSSEMFENDVECRRGVFCGEDAGEDVLDSGRRPLGSVRLSLGWMSRYEDIQAWLDFLRHVILQGVGLAPLLPPLSMKIDQKNEINLTLTHLYIYPVKSCGSMCVNEWPLSSMSLAYDREWTVVDRNLYPLTLKRLPALARIKPYVDLERKQLVLNAHNHSPLIIDFSDDSTVPTSLVRLATGSSTSSDGISCRVYGGEVELWFTGVLGIYATLARRAGDTPMTLANESAFLLVHESSVKAISSDLLNNEHVTHERFRPNFVVNRQDGAPYEAYIEDSWKRLVIGEDKVELASAGLCRRCPVVNVDPNTGKNQSRLFAQLQTQRRETNSARANFGLLLNISSADKNTLIRVGDRVQAFIE